MAKKSPTSIYYDADTCALAEEVRNGEPIDWGYWFGRSGITPAQAAKLAHCIDPMKWPNDQWAQGEIKPSVLFEIRRKTDYLADRSDKWELHSLAELLGPDEAPYAMKAEIHKRQAAQREAQYAKQAKDKKQAGRYTLEEAAQELAKQAGERENTILEKLCRAAFEGALPVYYPGEHAQHEYPKGGTVAQSVRTFYEEAHWDDLNRWLEANHPRISWLFPNPQGDKPSLKTIKENQTRNPTGGDVLTPIIWKICNEMKNAGEAVKQMAVMAALKALADGDPKNKGPLIGSVAGGVKYEDAIGNEKELTSSQLQSRIAEWKRANS